MYLYTLLLVVPEIVFKSAITRLSSGAKRGASQTQNEITRGLQGQILRVCRLFLLEARPILYGENHFVVGDVYSFQTVFYPSIPSSCHALIKSLTIVEKGNDIDRPLDHLESWARTAVFNFDNLPFIELKYSFEELEGWNEVPSLLRSNYWGLLARLVLLSFYDAFRGTLPCARLEVQRLFHCTLRARFFCAPAIGTVDDVGSSKKSASRSNLTFLQHFSLLTEPYADIDRNELRRATKLLFKERNEGKRPKHPSSAPPALPVTKINCHDLIAESVGLMWTRYRSYQFRHTAIMNIAMEKRRRKTATLCVFLEKVRLVCNLETILARIVVFTVRCPHVSF